MTGVASLLEKGGPVMIAIITLSVLLYAGCLKLLISLRRSRRELEGCSVQGALQERVEEAAEEFRRQRLALGAMVTAAPLLGLLGTVSGMVKTFESLSGHPGEKTMEGLASGISQVLVSTESGLVVAIPALLILHLAHRELRRCLARANRIEQSALSHATP
jgi:biopolymer transport protein ExbB/TolQ